MASAAGLVHAAAARRLLHDLKEVLEHPIPNVSALPLDDDIFTWHGNVRSSPEGTLQGSPVHFILHFPPDYPRTHPEVRLLQDLPHPNLQRAAGIQVLAVGAGTGGSSSSSSSNAASLSAHRSRPFPREARWRLAMWDCIPGHNSWSSAYSVLSVLLQLQVFLLDEDLCYDTRRITPEQAAAAAAALSCPHCTHSGNDAAAVHPPFPTQQQLDQALNMRAKLTVAKPFVPARSRVTAEQLRQHQRPLSSSAAAGLINSKGPSPCPSVVVGVGRASQASSSSSSSSSAPSAPASPASSRPNSSPGPAAAAAIVAAADDGWTTVQHKHYTPQQHQQQQQYGQHSSMSQRGGYSGTGRGRGRGRGRGGSSSGGGWANQPGPAMGWSGGRGSSSSTAAAAAAAAATAAGRGRGAGRFSAAGRGAMHTGSSSSSSSVVFAAAPGSSRGGRGGGRGMGGRGPAPASQQQQQQQQVVKGGSFAALLEAPAVAVASAASAAPQQQQQQQAALVGAATPQALSKTAKKNAARKARRQQQHNDADTAPAAASSAAPAAAHTTNQQQQQKQAPQSQQQQQQQDEWVAVKASKAQQKASQSKLLITPLQAQLQQLMQQPMQQLVASAKAGTALLLPPTDTDTADAADADCPSAVADQYASSSSSNTYGQPAAAAASTAAAAAAAGPFIVLGRDALLEILCLLEPSAVAALGQTCVALHAAVEDGAVWQVMMSKAFPGHRLRPSNMAEWKAAFQLESCCVLDELRCWMTRAGPEEDVLGLPLTYTTNPATKKVDWILAHPDVLSVTAFKMGVRTTPQGEKFDALLPLYLTASHFNCALPHLSPLLALLAPEAVGRGGAAPEPSTWLEVLPKILNTQVVLLSDNGLSVSQRSLSVYCQVHRLLLAVCEHWGLWTAVARKLDAFANNPAARTKSGTPNLGLLLPLLAVGNPSRHSWRLLSDAVLRESLSRMVLWMCKKDTSLMQRFRTPRGGPADPVLLSSAWEGAAVSAKLQAFHVAFLQLVACPRGATLESVMDSADALYGWPAAALGVRFQKIVKRIQELSSWREWFVLLGRERPSDQALTDLLRWSWSSGEAKGYHSVNTDFSKIHRSGVSKILLEGQTYAMPPAAKSVDLIVHYKWRPEVAVYYLDGAVLLMGPGRTLIEAVAWNHQSSTQTARPGCVTHSGDIMEFDQQKGANNAHINFGGLGPGVVEVFVTLSAWNTAMLSDIMQPYVQLIEPDTGVELCQIHLDSLEAAAKRTHKCIIMARFYKGQNGKWTVANVGTLCHGDTGHYDEMLVGCRAVV